MALSVEHHSSNKLFFVFNSGMRLDSFLSSEGEGLESSLLGIRPLLHHVEVVFVVVVIAEYHWQLEDSQGY